MPNILKRAVMSYAIFAILGAGSASAVDDRFNPHSYEKGGFAPANNAAYKKECGDCHFLYLPGMLPARSWSALMSKANEHFGEALSLAPAVSREIEQYLVSNAAEKTDYLGGGAILYRLRDESTPLRITDLPVFRTRHFMAAYVTNSTARVNTSRPFPPAARKVLIHCGECHDKASTGSFAYDEIVIQDVTKVIRPGGLF